MIDYSKLLMIVNASSNKVIKEGSGVINVPALSGAGSTYATATIPHGYATDNLLFQVSTNGGPTDGVMLPWQSSDSRVTQYASVDSVNLYITVISSSASPYGAGGYAINYFYRILAP